MSAAHEAAPVDADAIAQVLAGGLGLPREAYTSPEVHAWELRAFHDDAWVCVGRIETIAPPGTQRAIRAGGEGVLLVRDDAGTIRGFYNVCRHRGHELVQLGECARGRQIRCPYHGWVYALDGSRRGGGDAREAGANCDPAPKDERGLVPVRVDTWRGFVFVNLSGSAIPLRAWLGDLDALVAAHDLEALCVAATHGY